MDPFIQLKPNYTESQSLLQIYRKVKNAGELMNNEIIRLGQSTVPDFRRVKVLDKSNQPLEDTASVGALMKQDDSNNIVLIRIEDMEADLSNYDKYKLQDLSGFEFYRYIESRPQNTDDEDDIPGEEEDFEHGESDTQHEIPDSKSHDVSVFGGEMGRHRDSERAVGGLGLDFQPGEQHGHAVGGVDLSSLSRNAGRLDDDDDDDDGNDSSGVFRDAGRPDDDDNSMDFPDPFTDSEEVGGQSPMTHHNGNMLGEVSSHEKHYERLPKPLSTNKRNYYGFLKGYKPSRRFIPSSRGGRTRHRRTKRRTGRSSRLSNRRRHRRQEKGKRRRTRRR